MNSKDSLFAAAIFPFGLVVNINPASATQDIANYVNVKGNICVRVQDVSGKEAGRPVLDH
ncbi:MAG: hypothetical protein JOZ17_19600 [Acetobacteraceae bacterium]|nr:hypothetical protein [Acetobacteraceae bacterium]